ncbi:hypothetical protein [Brucella anthropi]|uniref:hypothetical protein n=1 Tax=Brucella anthropi TaxID=529 RepID=UPI003208EF7D
MPSKELIEKVARALFEAIDENTYKSKEDGDAWGVVDGEVNFHELSQAAISTIRAALQEPTRPMSEIGQPYVRVGYDAWDVWRAMLAASALGEQIE